MKTRAASLDLGSPTPSLTFHLATRSLVSVATALLLLATGMVGATHAATILVPGDQPTIQAGIDAAQTGDVVLVAPGSYSGPGNEDIDFGGKDIELRSEDGPEVTTIQGPGFPEDDVQSRAFQFLSGESAAALVEGFTIRDFWIIETVVVSSGGGAVAIVGGAEPTFRDCVFLGNFFTDGSGGAVYAQGGLFEDCLFQGNTAESWNAGGNAGAISIRNGTLRRCEIRGNAAIEGQFGGGGAGGVAAGQNTMIEDCIIVGNRARRGGGVSFGATSLSEPMESWISGTTIADNEAWAGASQLYFASGTNVPGQRLYITTSIIWSGDDCGPNDVETFEEIAGVARLTFICSIIDPSAVVGPMETLYDPHSTDDDPLFCDPYTCGMSGPIGDYSLQPESPCLPEASSCGALIGAIGDVCGTSDLPGIEPGATALSLEAPRPNPTRTDARFVISLEHANPVRATIFDAAGRRVVELLGTTLDAGSHSVAWNLSDSRGRRVPAGIYSLKVVVPGAVETARLTVLE